MSVYTLLSRTLLLGVALFTVNLVDLFAADGDTIRVKTLTFSDTTKRSGTWLFPPPQRYEKVLMEYTLKCDPATTQDNFPCGEWDYLTYTVLTDSTGQFDSTRKLQVNYMVRATTPDTFAYSNNVVSAAKRYRGTSVTRIGPEGTFIEVGSGGQSNTALFRTVGGRMRYMWRASELTAAGVTAGRISGISLKSIDSAGTVTLLTIRIGQTTNPLVSLPLSNTDLTTVVRRNVVIDNGVNSIPFSSAFMWDGTSNIILDLSCYGSAINSGVEAGSSITNGFIDDANRYVYAFTASDKIEVPASIGTSLDKEITVAFWSWGNPAKLPRDHNILEAFNSSGQRVLNIHLPWSNGNIYWDAGRNAGGGLDRIEVGAIPENYEGKWNHWAFTKNASTGSMRMYLNGEVFFEGNGKILDMKGITRLIVGSGAAASYEGLIDEFQIWNKALDQNTIKSWMHRHVSNLHPDYQKLQLIYSAENEIGGQYMVAHDESDYSRHGELFGMPTRMILSGEELGHLTATSTARPLISFETGTINVSSARADVTIPQQPVRTSVVLFQNAVLPIVYPPQVGLGHPASPTDTLTVYQAGNLMITDEIGAVVDSMYVPPQTVLRKIEKPYFNPVVDFEIGRYITPYGIGLDLGPKGFKWVYDVTDFAPLLRNNVTLSAGNQQELIDLTFVFIKGTPPRDVKQIDQVYYDRGAMFPAVLNNTALPPITVPLRSDVRTFRLKAVTSGHDFSNATNCAEFCQRTHFFEVDGVERFSWNLWKECGDNPVYPQGGTWLIDRTGWCPGAPVDLYDFELTPYAAGKSSVVLDYGVKKQTAEENWGRWEVSGQLIGYSAPNHSLDVEVQDIISPNSWELYSRLNPICGQPVVVIRNTGGTPLTTCTIKYGVEGGSETEYTWNGNLAFMQSATVTLPQPAWVIGEGQHTFWVRVESPNGGTDQYAINSQKSTSFIMPPVYYSDLQMVLRTNKEAALQYVWKLKKSDGTVIDADSNLTDNTTYTKDFVLENGCYDYELVNKEGYGLDFWFLRDQLGSGYLNFKSGGTTIKTFEPDFGNRAWMQFIVGPKPTIATNVDTVFFITSPTNKVIETVVIRSLTDVDVHIDSINAFSIRNHFSVESISKTMPTTLAKGDSIVVEVGFLRSDAGTTTGNLRIYNNDERASVKSVRLVGEAIVLGVGESNASDVAGVEVGVVPNPYTSTGKIIVNTLDQSLIGTECTIRIHDVTGAMIATVYRGEINATELNFGCPLTLTSGMYSVSVETKNGTQYSSFVVAN